MATQTTKTTTKTRTYAVLDRDFTYEFYERVTTKPAGTRLLLGRDGMGDRLTAGGDLVIILGHGVDELIPKDAFHLEDETTTKTTTVRTITVRRA